MRPKVTFLNDDEVTRIIDRALSILTKLGLHLGSDNVIKRISGADGLGIQGDRVTFTPELIEKCLKTAPSKIEVYPQEAAAPYDLSGDNVHYVAGSVAPYVYADRGHSLREPTCQDLVEHIKVLEQCDSIDFQSGSYVIKDVARQITSSYRYYLSLLYSPKPIFGGAFGLDDLQVIHQMLSVMVGGDDELEKRPLAVIAANPSSPLGISEIVAENMAYCAEHKMPVMVIPIPLGGGSSPVTLAGTLVQHTAEILGSVAIGQLIQPGAPMIFGGGPSIMDMKRGTACQASTESVIMGASIGQIAKKLSLPCATNTGRADSKAVDYQAGEETGVGLTLMAVAGLNMIRGAGTLEYANVVSKEKLLLDNEICRMAKHMVSPMRVSNDALAEETILERAPGTEGYLSAPHTNQFFRDEFVFPSRLIDRGSRREFDETGKKDAFERAAAEVEKILATYEPRQIDPGKKEELDKIILSHAKQYGMTDLPVMTIG